MNGSPHTARGAGPLGFTLVELLIVVAVLAVVLTLAAPSFRDMIETQRLRGTSAQLVTDVQFARTEAVSRGETVGMTYGSTAGGMSCYTIHTCGQQNPNICTCDCTRPEGSRCTAPRREIRTQQVAADTGVRLVPVPVPPLTRVPANLVFDPTTGAMSTYYPGSIFLPPLPDGSDFWTEVVLTRTSNLPSLRTEVNGNGRPRTCAPGGRVSGFPSC
ncbi:MAG: GspH/FimT family pseudopilin [Rubrivivax sp.]|nr:GspH/FimT family pseudopilin [Rubrivivax sp.]